MIVYFSFCVIFSYVSSTSFFSSEVVVYPLSGKDFSLSLSSPTYYPRILGKSDLPKWLHYTFNDFGEGYLYGTPPKNSKTIKLEIIVKDEDSFSTQRKIMDLAFKNASVKRNQVRFKLTNLNANELLDVGRLERLKRVIVEDLWPGSAEDGAFTDISTATALGDSLPLSPNDKEGVYVSFGSVANFSEAIRELEVEVRPLWHHRPCPKYFKKTSYERFFRHKGFAVDWCSFKPFTLKEESNSAVQKISDTIPVKRVSLIAKKDVIVRSYFWDAIYTILIPLVVMFGLIGILTLTMCCSSDKVIVRSIPYFDEVFDGFPRSLVDEDGEVCRAVSAERSARGGQSEPSSATATMARLGTSDRSVSGSPSASLLRSSVAPDRFDDVAMYSRPFPPPYPKRINSDGEESLDAPSEV